MFFSLDCIIALLLFKAGLRTKEIASLTTAVVSDPHGDIADEITLGDGASNGRGGPPPLEKALQDALSDLQAARGVRATSRGDYPVIYSEPGSPRPVDVCERHAASGRGQ